MSKSSAKQRITQLKEWLVTFKKGEPVTAGKRTSKFSKADHYKKTRNRYGKKSN